MVTPDEHPKDQQNPLGHRGHLPTGGIGRSQRSLHIYLGDWGSSQQGVQLTSAEKILETRVAYHGSSHSTSPESHRYASLTIAVSG